MKWQKKPNNACKINEQLSRKKQCEKFGEIIEKEKEKLSKK
jgi:hypothetical protein